MRCIWCGLYFCEDCVNPHNHYCPAYKEGMEYSVDISRVYSIECYERFATSEDLEEENVSELSAEEKEVYSQEHIIKSNLIFQERLRLGVGEPPDRCPNCESTLNKVDEKCDLCGIKFCASCVAPNKHNCVIAQYELEKNPTPVKPEVIVESSMEAEIIAESIVDSEVSEPIKIDVPKERTEIRKVSFLRRLLHKFF